MTQQLLVAPDHHEAHALSLFTATARGLPVYLGKTHEDHVDTVWALQRRGNALLWHLAAVCFSYERQAPGPSPGGSSRVPTEITRFCGDTQMSRRHFHRLSLTYETFTTEISDTGVTYPPIVDSPLQFKHFLVAANHAEDPWAAVVEAHDEGWSANEFYRRLVQGKIRAARQARLGDATGTATVTRASWEDWIDDQPACDLLFTDPPYHTDVDNIAAFASAWLPLALGTVKATGRAYICIGAYPDELAAYLAVPAAPLSLQQVLVWTYRNTLGPAPTHDYKLNWQAILYYRGTEAPALGAASLAEQFSVFDVSAPDGRRGEREHAWQKPEDLAERIIRHSTMPDDLVLDPFAGTGTFLAVAAQLGRHARGCEIDATQIHACRDRGVAIAR